MEIVQDFSNSTVFLHANDQFGSRELVVKGVKTSSLSFPMEYIRVLLYEHNIKLVDCQGCLPPKSLISSLVSSYIRVLLYENHSHLADQAAI